MCGYFFLLAVFGWLWEGFLYLFKDGTYVNRGFLTGPWLPVLWAGGVMLEVLFHRWRDRPILTFVSSMVLCTVLEYLAGWYLELTWGVRWWGLQLRIMEFAWKNMSVQQPSLWSGRHDTCMADCPVVLFSLLQGSAEMQTGAGLLVLILFLSDAAYSAMWPHVGKGITY